MSIFKTQSPLTAPQIRRKLVEQLSLSLQWSKHNLNGSAPYLEKNDLEDLKSIRTEIKTLIKRIDQ